LSRFLSSLTHGEKTKEKQQLRERERAEGGKKEREGKRSSTKNTYESQIVYVDREYETATSMRGGRAEGEIKLRHVKREKASCHEEGMEKGTSEEGIARLAGGGGGMVGPSEGAVTRNGYWGGGGPDGTLD